MKKIFIVTILLLIISCKTKPLLGGINYRIIKIDSIENINLISVEKSDVLIKDTSILKIASTKTGKRCKRNEKITIGKNYKFNLTSLYPINFVSHHYLGGLNFNGVYIPFDKDYRVKRDLFITKNLEGICYRN